MPSNINSLPEPEDDLHVADMDIEAQYMPNKKEKKKKEKKFVRMAAGTSWEDPSLGEWDNGKSIFMFLHLVIMYPCLVIYCCILGG